MEVTKRNFDSILKEVLQEIEGCSFTSMDLEISGLWKEGEPGILDSQETSYSLFLESASEFTCLQVGLSFFTLQPPSSSYQVKSYSFYVFPSQAQKNAKVSFSCQSSSIQFLTANNFDFNKVFYEGVPYLNIQKEQELNQVLEERRYFKAKNQVKELIDIPAEHADLVNDTCEKLSRVLKEEGTREVKVPGLNAFIRRLVYQTMKQRYPEGEVLVDTRDGCLVSRKGQIDGNIPRTQEEIDEDVVNQAVGFSKIIRAISKSGKPLVGHNAFLDLCHIIKSFLCDLPESYTEFKGLVKGLFPVLLDTKFMSTRNGLNDLISGTTLSRLYSRIQESPFSLPPAESKKGYSYDKNFEKYHDAGFDSYVTGIVFISLYNYLVGSKASLGNVPFNPKSEKLKQFVNRIYMNNTPDNYIFFGGADPHPDRSHFFHLKFPKEWVSKDIFEYFSSYSRVNVNWIDSTSAWISLQDKSQSDVVRVALHSPEGHVILTPYSNELFRSIFEGRRHLPSEHKKARNHGDFSASVTPTLDTPENKEGASSLGRRRQGKSHRSGSLDSSSPVAPKKRRGCEIDPSPDSPTQDSAIAELEMDLDNNKGSASAPFVGTARWDVS